MSNKIVKAYRSKLDEGNAYWMARISKAVYQRMSDKNPAPNDEAILYELREGDPNRKNDLTDPDFEQIVSVDKNSAQAALVIHKSYACIAFRGTDQPADWLDNANVFGVETAFGTFHKGFYRSCMDVWQTLYDEYQELKRKDLANKRSHPRPLFLTGHSLGGAMCSVAATEMLTKDEHFISAYTFGQPRTMNHETSIKFSSLAGNRYFRFQNNNDIVTRVPARIMNYSHVGSLLYIDEHKTIHNDSGFWFRFLDSVTGALESISVKGLDIIEDHDMNDYLHAVQNWNTDFD